MVLELFFAADAADDASSFSNEIESNGKSAQSVVQEIVQKSNEKGFTIVPTDLFINDKGLAKVNIALAKGKHFYDKRDNLKDKDNKKEIERAKYKYD